SKCNAPVTVSAASINSSVFTILDTIPIKVKPFSVYKMRVRFSPQQRGVYDGVITVNSDAEDNPILSVTIRGRAIKPPIIVVAPDTIGKTLAYGTISKNKVTLVNKGEAPFYFKIKSKSVKKSGKLGLEDAIVFVSQNFGTIRKLNLATGEFIGDPIIYMNGSDYDALAYDGENLYYSNYTNQIIVIDPKNGKIIDTIECETPSGTYGIGVIEDYLVLGNYNYSKVYVCEKQTGKVVYEWYADGFSGGLGCSESRNSVFLYSWYNGAIEERRIEDGSLINSISSDLIWGLSYSEAAGVIIASTSWEIRVIDPATGKVISTLPISYVFAIGADECGYIDWLSSDIKEGVVPAGGTAGAAISFNAIFNTLNKFSGTYEGLLQIKHKRPIPPGPFNIKCAMTVLEQRRCKASPSKLEFTETWLGRTDTLSFFLVNSGNSPTTVNSMSSNNTLFSIYKNAPFAIPPFDSVKVDVGFTPKKCGSFCGKITVLSNADSLPQVTVELKGKAVEPPKITYSPKKIVDVMLPDKENKHTIKLKNTGGAAYKFNVTAEALDNSISKARFFGGNWQGIFELDPESGSIIDTIIFTNGDYSLYGPLAYDGRYIFVANWWEDFIKIIDPDKKKIVDSIDLSPNDYYYVSDIGVSRSYFFVFKYDKYGDGYK
ncbi:MAG: choice-of-anchor D domain-containing protein, partial [Chitinispirillaceae bacterium]|nr:choice-of-anchor D domain-containing protein [Chitinispirillaceae bacterium]